MENKDSYFDGALSNFIFDFACGGAIRHLADQGYSAAQIVKRLDYPLSLERVREAVTAYYLEKGILLREEPCGGSVPERYEYVQDHDKFGKPSFRRVPVKTQSAGNTGGTGKTESSGSAGSARSIGNAGSAEHSGAWTKRSMDCKEAAEFLTGCTIVSGEKAASGDKSNRKIADARRQADSYVSCDYGSYPADSEVYGAMNERQREYLQGINWDRRRMYHLLDARMREIVIRLCERGCFEGKIYLGPERKIITVGKTEDN